jgi:hypothetical protein
MTNPLAKVRRATLAKQRAEARYRASLVAAVDALETGRNPGAYALVAAAAGVSRQAVRQLVRRERGTTPPTR